MVFMIIPFSLAIFSALTPELIILELFRSSERSKIDFVRLVLKSSNFLTPSIMAP